MFFRRDIVGFRLKGENKLDRWGESRLGRGKSVVVLGGKGLEGWVGSVVLRKEVVREGVGG